MQQMAEYMQPSKSNVPFSRTKILKLSKHIPLNENKSINSQHSVGIRRIPKKGLKIPPKYANSKPFDVADSLRTFSRRRNVKNTKPEQLIMSEPRTICDVDNTFFKIIEGRPLRQFVDVKVYMSNIRDITLSRANAAYLKEQIIQIDTAITDEHHQFEKIHNLNTKTKSSFIKFVEQRYNIVKCLQEEAEAKSEELNDMIELLSTLSFTYGKLRNEVDSLVVILENLSKYGNFLNLLSPYWWRILYDKDFEENNFLFAKIFTDLDTPSGALLKVYKSNVGFLNKTSPKIYFKKAYQLFRIFENISKQCLNYMQIECYSANILRPVLQACNRLKTRVYTEINEVKDFITFYETETKCMEDKEIEYKYKFNRILYNEFQKLYASFESTNLYTCVQYVHTQLISVPEDPKDNIITLANGIENLYINLTSQLDCLNQDLVNKVTRELFAEDINVMKKAHRAHRTLREFSMLKKSLITSFEPPRFKHK